MKLIDADVLIEQMDAEPEGGYYSPHDVISLLMTQPVVEESKTGTPCDLCRHNPPSSGDGKPCSYCPAERI